MLIELSHLNSKRIKKDSKLRLKQWQHMFEMETYIIDAGGISYGSLGACHIWRIILGEREIHFG